MGVERALVCVVAAWGCSGSAETIEVDAAGDAAGDVASEVGQVDVGVDADAGGWVTVDAGELPRGLSCEGDVAGVDVSGAGARGKALEVTDEGVFWLASESGRLTIGPPDGPRVDLGPDAELADLAARPDGEVCAIWRRGEEDVGYACSPGFVVESTSAVPATRALVLAQGDRLCTESSCVESVSGYAFYHDENNTAAAATRFGGVWSGGVFGEQPLGKFGDALAWEGRPVACLMDSGGRGAVVAYGAASAQMERQATEEELLFRGSPGVDACRMAAVGAGVEVVWFGGGFGDYEVRLGTFSPYDPETGEGPTYTSAPLDLGLENAGYTVAAKGDDLYVAYDAARAVRLARREAGAWEDEELVGEAFGNVGSPKAAVGPDGSLHVVAAGQDGPAYWRWCTD